MTVLIQTENDLPIHAHKHVKPHQSEDRSVIANRHNKGLGFAYDLITAYDEKWKIIGEYVLPKPKEQRS